jgi:hypothetical protein
MLRRLNELAFPLLQAGSLDLIFQCIQIDRQGIASPWCAHLRLICHFEIIVENTALAFRLRGFVPVHVIIDFPHSCGEFPASNLQVQQALCDSFPLAARKVFG